MTYPTPKLRRMRSRMILLCLSLALSIHGGVFQPVPTQLPQASFAEGGTAILKCPLEKGKIQDYHVFWFQQKPAARPDFVLKHSINGQIERSSQFDARFVPIRDAGANAYVLQIQGVRTEDSATYWCMAEANYFSIAVSGSGTQLSIKGGNSVRAPSSVTLLSDISQTTSTSAVHALCIVEQFYPGILEIKWNMAGNDVTEGVTPGQVIVNKDGSYSTSSVLSISKDLLSSKMPVKCSIHHESSGAVAEQSLNPC
ncbi:immunoglobulin kappa light chain-like [Sceloporus undulatus]|uniref:immunoglobulin kappa light chain-like n=1 Tax=Sceloporus undulatus TaxID=8520 RepID=UPI001C4D7F53|nr:immunoglobulin kappa light chain-like [Sceloporus undulatus]